MSLALASLFLLLAPPSKAADPMARLDSEHFLLRYEDPRLPPGILNDLEGLRAKLLLDLALFAPWAQEGRIEVRLYRDAESYRRQTGAPAWSGGQATLGLRRLDVFPGPSLRRTLAHEMAHLFFDDFFIAGSTRPARAPTWLSEGVAVRMEWDYGLSGERPEARGDPLPLAELLRWSSQDSHSSAAAARLYAQAYGLTRFLMTRFTPHQFFLFCDALRSGGSLDASLAASYGLPMPDSRALERLWLESREAR